MTSARLFPRCLLTSDDITVDMIQSVNQHLHYHPGLLPNCSGHTVCTLFYEPSTRTRLSFERATQDLNAKLLSVSNPREVLSLALGESFEDTIRTVSCFADTLVLRHPDNEASERASIIAPDLTVISAGSGISEHPTQTLIDLHVVWKRLLWDSHTKRQLRPYEGLRVAYVGDIKYSRTARSLLRVGSKLGWIQTIIAPSRCWPSEMGLASLSTDSYDPTAVVLLPVLASLDVLYIVGHQKERMMGKGGPDSYIVKDQLPHYRITAEWLKILSPHAIIMHPLPRGNEADIDNDPRSAIWDQARAAVPVRRLILSRTWGYTI